MKISTQQKRASISDCNTLAQRLRERELQIESVKRDIFARFADAIVLMRDQGADLLTARTKLLKITGFREWLHAHVPSLPLDLASKYERILKEQLASPRECFFALLPPAEKTSKMEIPRTPPSEAEMRFGAASKAKRELLRAGMPVPDEIEAVLKPPPGWFKAPAAERKGKP